MKELKNNILFYFTMCLFIFIFSGGLYYFLELITRGYSHSSMFILAGFIGILIALMNDFFYTFETDYIVQVLTATAVCCIGEGICGLIVNVLLGLNVWDYSNLWGTYFFGQCNILFTFIWMVICTFSIPLLDYIEWKLFDFGDQPPYYKIGNKVIFRFKEKKEK